MTQESHLAQLYRLANQDKTEDIKSSILALVIIVFFAISSLLTMGLRTQWSNPILVGALSCWFLGFSLLIIFSFVSNNKNFYLWLIAITASGMLPLIIKYHYQKWILLAIIILYSLFALARWRIRGEFNSAIRLSWERLIRSSSMLLTISILVLGSFLMFFPFDKASFQSVMSVVNHNKVNSILSYNGISLNSKIDDIIQRYAQKQISSIHNSVLANIAIKKTKDNLSQYLHVPITGQETIWQVAVKWFKYHWGSLPQYGKIAIGIIVFLMGWSIIVGINSVFYFVFLLLSGVLFWLLIKLKFIVINHQTIEKETFGL